MSEQPASGWAVSGAIFAASMLFIVGVFQVIAGISAIAEDSVIVPTRNYTFDLDVTAWGWIHLIIGIILVLTAIALFSGSVWAGTVAILIAMLSAIENFFFIPYQPWWSILIIALDIWIIWALTRPGVLRT